jgi:hypothetical protein
MRSHRKILVAVAALLILSALTPAFAQLAGTWEGEGKGCCYPRNSVIIYPWQSWKGQIPNTEDVFIGEWYDVNGEHGIFKSEVTWVSLTTAVAKGSWYWYDPLGPSAQPVYGGDFKMTFYVYDQDCGGEWWTHWPSPSAVGTMKGYKVP